MNDTDRNACFTSDFGSLSPPKSPRLVAPRFHYFQLGHGYIGVRDNSLVVFLAAVMRSMPNLVCMIFGARSPAQIPRPVVRPNPVPVRYLVQSGRWQSMKGQANQPMRPDPNEIRRRRSSEPDHAVALAVAPERDATFHAPNRVNPKKHVWDIECRQSDPTQATRLKPIVSRNGAPFFLRFEVVDDVGHAARSSVAALALAATRDSSLAVTPEMPRLCAQSSTAAQYSAGMDRLCFHTRVRPIGTPMSSAKAAAVGHNSMMSELKRMPFKLHKAI